MPMDMITSYLALAKTVSFVWAKANFLQHYFSGINPAAIHNNYQSLNTQILLKL